MTTYADLCRRMLTYADVCLRMLSYASGMRHILRDENVTFGEYSDEEDEEEEAEEEAEAGKLCVGAG